ncbi:MAG: hypothetical protein WDN67_02915 [Candidatus Moraniibacteriota bacterium]
MASQNEGRERLLRWTIGILTAFAVLLMFYQALTGHHHGRPLIQHEADMQTGLKSPEAESPQPVPDNIDDLSTSEQGASQDGATAQPEEEEDESVPSDE